MELDYVAAYRRLYQDHWWWRAREEAVLAVIRRHHRVRSSTDAVLDVGCGDGLFFDKLRSFGDVWGLEGDPQAVSAQNPNRDRITVARFDESFAPGRSFRLITMLDVLEHLPNEPEAVGKLYDLLADDGTLVLTVPAFQSLWTSHDTMNQHVTRYTKATLRPALEAAGFRVSRMTYLFHWLAAAKLGVRLKESLLASEPSIPEVPSAAANRLLTTVSQFDLRGGRGWGLPFGSSLLAVAKKSAQ